MEDKLKTLNCHFTWNILESSTENDQERSWISLLEYLDVDIKMNPDIELQALTYKAYLLQVIKNESDKAVAVLNEVIRKCSKINPPSHAKGNEYISLCNMAWILKDKPCVDDILMRIELLMPLQDGAKALISGSRGYALHLCGKKAYLEAMKCYKRAYALERNHFGWPLGVAILAGRLRRIIEGPATIPTELEKETLEKAIELSGNQKALPIVFMADLIFACGRSFRGISQEKDESLLNSAKILYQQAYALAPTSSHVLNRCGKAFRLMDENELAEKYLVEAVKVNPNNSTCNHRLGQLYEHSLRDFQLAKIYYEKAVTVAPFRNLFAEMDLMRIRRRLDTTFDIIKHLNDMKSVYDNDPQCLARIDMQIQKQKEYDDAQAKRQQQQGNDRSRSSNRSFRGGPNHRRGFSRPYQRDASARSSHRDENTRPNQRRDGSTRPYQRRDGSTGPNQRRDGSTGPNRGRDGSTGPNQRGRGSGYNFRGSQNPRNLRDGSNDSRYSVGNEHLLGRYTPRYDKGLGLLGASPFAFPPKPI